jgi:hypothetical protein
MAADPEVAVNDCTAVSEHGPFRLVATGATLTAPPTFDEWFHATMWAISTERASAWWVGDLLAYGADKWSDRYHEAASLSGYTEETLRNRVWVSRAVPLSRRRDTLTYSAHVEVASLPADDQVEWLDRAEVEELSAHALRRKIQESKAKPIEVAPRKVVAVTGPTTTISLKAPFTPVLVEPARTKAHAVHGELSASFGVTVPAGRGTITSPTPAAAVEPDAYWISVLCSSEAEQRDLAERLRGEGLVVELGQRQLANIEEQIDFEKFSGGDKTAEQ